ncbi:MAG: hypothetical protein KDA94_04860 [Acidimicrobiales bacterium]|nr:hypothetical protein [Acidimicrobiales bacterium]
MTDGSSRLVIGLGTGRCGTHSLADLLAAQPGTVAMHQPAPCLPWHVDFGWYRDVNDLIAAQGPAVVALVAWYYLPYVDLLARDHDVRFVCLQRDRASTVASIDRLTAQFDHWSNRSPSHSANERWRSLFPSYDVDDKVEALGRYYDEYYERARAHADAMPDRFSVFATTDLNDDGGVAAILRAAGYGPEAHPEVGIRSGLMQDYRWEEPG